MLDNETKRRIDTARDILVGKVPDPKSQVEQITIALVYKFMDDMDKESVSMGGKPSFFTGDYERYTWTKIFDPRIGGHEMLNLYGEAIIKLNQNPNIPQLFRDIFKNAYLPYRDPETLKLFLKTINEFTYDHSERLGDAFEYLLSVLGSQGDAGQFRTPRHIIDFMVKVVNPQKNETVLDPACGTAGFLVSAYKHIVRENTSPNLRSENGNNRGDLLNTEERKNLLTNFKGYDISPDMVRLSLVNLYLHGFVQPQIYEYDTLTSEDRWNEYYDLIFANPPFMSPKGGIKPHKKFSVQSNRSEVLFVDYIAEHLTPTGRAAVIVPEGIIFQSAGAYKQLRKMLVENYLYAVVSLPAGLFNPYSGVKTSILFMDRSIAKKADSLLFLKIENDGYGLGAQRREQTGSDLPDAVNIIKDYYEAVKSGVLDTFKTEEKTCGAIMVSKLVLSKNDDYNLSGDRYYITKKIATTYPIVKLGDEELFQIESGGTPDSAAKEYWDGDIKWITLVDLPAKNLITEISDSQRKITEKGLKNCSAKLLVPDSVIISSRATIGRIAINKVPLATNQGFKNILIKDYNRVSAKFIALMLTRQVEEIKKLASGGTFKEISKTVFKTIQLPLPPISIQKEIVSEIEDYQKIIDGARQVVDNWKPEIEIDPEWQVMELGTIAETSSGGTPLKAHKEYYTGGTIPWLKSGEVSQGFIYITEEKITMEGLSNSSAKLFPKNTVLVAMYGATSGQVGILKIESSTNQAVCGILPNEKFIPEFLFYYLKGQSEILLRMGTGGAQPNISQSIIRSLKVPCPDLLQQRTIIDRLEREQMAIAGNKELIEAFEAKIKKVIDKVWEG